MNRVIFHREAKNDFLQAADWYEAESVELMRRFIAAVDNAVNAANRRFDSLERVTRRDRRIRVERFPFCLIVRRLDATTLIIVAIAHHKRRTGFWRRRK